MPKSPEIITIEDWCHQYRGRFTNDEIKDAVCEAYRIPTRLLLQKKGVRDVADAKHCFTWFTYQLQKISLKSIADFLGLADHSTIIKSKRRAEDYLQSGDTHFVGKVETVHQSLKKLLHERV